MPIYDSDRSTAYNIDKIYDSDRTTNYQIKTVYDSDRVNTYIVYSADYTVFNNGNATSYTGGWTLRSSGNGSASISSNIYTYAYNTANSYRAYFTTQKIPISQYSTITINWNRRSYGPYATWGWNRIALSSTTSVSWTNGYPTANMNYTLREGGNSAYTETFSYNIANISTDYYLEIISNSGVDTFGGYSASAYVYSIILS